MRNLRIDLIVKSWPKGVDPGWVVMNALAAHGCKVAPIDPADVDSLGEDGRRAFGILEPKRWTPKPTSTVTVADTLLDAIQAGEVAPR